MLNKPIINTSIQTSGEVKNSRAYTFIDSYIYMRNRQYNALYEKNKIALSTEKNGIDSESANILFYTAVEQTQALASVITRIKEFSEFIKNDVISNIMSLIPDNDVVSEFTDAVRANAFGKEKILSYDIQSIEYPNILNLYNQFKSELYSFESIKNDGVSVSSPIPTNTVAGYLMKVSGNQSNLSNSILNSEHFRIADTEDLNRIRNHIAHKNQIISIIASDFRTFNIFLREFKILQNMIDDIYPTVTESGKILIGKGRQRILNGFMDYLVIYKHYTIIIKYLMDMVSYYDTKFFNKIYCIQSNIEMERALMNNTISKYKTKIRNMNEYFNGIDGLVSGLEPFYMFSSDSVTRGEEEVKFQKENPKDKIEQERDITSEERIPYNELESRERPTSFPMNVKSYMRDAINNNGDLDKGYISINTFYKTLHPKIVMEAVEEVSQNATAETNDLRTLIDNIISEIGSADEKFEESANQIRSDNRGVIESVRNLGDLRQMDLSGIDFSMYRYDIGKERIDQIKIPKFKVSDIQILQASDGLAYKQKYFPTLFYFAQIGAPLNKNRFRGSISKKRLVTEFIPDVVDFFIRFIENYDKVIDSTRKTSDRIVACFNMLSQNNDKAYGTNEDVPANESYLARSVYKDEIISLMLESEGNKKEKSIEEIEQDAYERGLKDAYAQMEQPQESNPANDDEAEFDDLMNNQPQESTPESSDEAEFNELMNSDQTQSQDSNSLDSEFDAVISNQHQVTDQSGTDSEFDDLMNGPDTGLEIQEPQISDDTLRAMTQYCKIVYLVASTKMDVYEEILQTGFELLNVINESLGSGEVVPEE